MFDWIKTNVLNWCCAGLFKGLDSKNVSFDLTGKLELVNPALDENFLQILLQKTTGLPLQVVHCSLKHVRIQIPYMRLDTDRTEVTIKGMYLLLTLNQASCYDEKKEKEVQRAAKLAALDQSKSSFTNYLNAGGFAAAQLLKIIQNLYVTIEGIHIRYEHVSTPHKPIAFGVTLESLLLQSSDAKWQPMFVTKKEKCFFKIAALKNLAVYCLSEPALIHQEANRDQLASMKKGILTDAVRPYSDGYLLVLSTANAKSKMDLQYSPKQDLVHSESKYYVNLEVGDIAMTVNPSQCRDIVFLSGYFERIAAVAPFRKYRASLVNATDKEKALWKFAYRCVLEENVRRRNKSWLWSNIKEHHQTVRTYNKLYKSKLALTKVDSELQRKLEVCEDQLDVFNIRAVRNQVEAQPKTTSASWWQVGTSYLPFGSPIQKERQPEVCTISEPVNYVKLITELSVNKLSVQLQDANQKKMLSSDLLGVRVYVKHLPSKEGLSCSVNVGHFSVDGSNGARVVYPVKSEAANSSDFLEVCYDMNPEDRKCNSRIKLKASPFEIVYDAPTLKRTVDVLQSCLGSRNVIIQSVAQYIVKDSGITSNAVLEYYIQQHPILDLDIDIGGCYIVIPYNGIRARNHSSVLCHIPRLSVKSKSTRSLDEHQTVQTVMCKEDLRSQIITRLYDKFDVEVNGFYVLSLAPHEDLMEVSSASHPCYVVKPVSIKANVEVAFSRKQHDLPKMKITGDIPSLHLHLIDARLANASVIFDQFLADITGASEPDTSSSKGIVSQQDQDVAITSGDKAGQSPFGEFDLRLNLNHAQVDLSLTKRLDSKLAEFILTGIELRNEAKTSRLSLELLDFKVVNPNAGSYREIVTMDEKVDNKAFKLCVTFPQTTEGRLSICLMPGRLKVVYVKKFIQQFFSFIDKFQRAKSAFIDALSVATESVQQAFTNECPFPDLEIALKGPYIIVPFSSTDEAVIVDLGYLTLKSRFEQRNVNKGTAIFDFFDLKFCDSKLSLGLFDGANIGQESLIVKPISFTSCITRNLSGSWYNDEPAFSVEAWFGKVALVQHDKVIERLLAMFNELSGGIDNIAAATEDDPVGPDVTGLAKEEQVSVPSKNSPGDVCVSLKMGLEELQIELFTGKSRKPLAKLQVQGFDVAGEIMCDNSMRFGATLRACLLQDTRPMKKNVGRLFYPTEKEAPNNMITVGFRRAADQNLTVNVDLRSFTFIVCPNYLLQCLNFYMNLGSAAKSTATSLPIATPTVDNQVTNPPTMEIKITWDKSEMFLVENIDSSNTNAVALNMKVLAGIKMTDKGMDAELVVEELRVFTCIFDPKKRQDTMAKVLDPCKIYCVLKNSDSNSDLLVDVSSIELRVSPGTIEILTNIANSMPSTESNLQEDEEDSTELVPLADHSNLWDEVMLSEHSLFETAVVESVIPVANGVVKRRLTIKPIRMKLVVESGKGNSSRPMIQVECGVEAKLSIASVIEGSTKLDLVASYYNNALTCWEPILEPVIVTAEDQIRPWALSIDSKQRKENESKYLDVSIKSDDEMKLTVTKIFLDVISIVAEDFANARKQR